MHCPHCGKPLAQSSRVCSACGGEIGAPDGERPMARTLVGSAAILGSKAEKQDGEDASPIKQDDPALGGRTVIGVPPPPKAADAGPKSNAAPTKIGFLTPVTAAKEDFGNRPSSSPLPEEPPRPSMEDRISKPPYELGATMAEKLARPHIPAKRLKVHALHIPKPLPPIEQRKAAYEKAAKKQEQKKRERRKHIIYGLSAGLSLVAVAGGIWFATRFSRSPLKARAITDAQGRESLELRCDTCPDGTQLSLGQRSSNMVGGVAVLPLESGLLVGENRLKIRIDRPEGHKDESAFVRLNVPYRIHSNTATLDADRPMLQVIVEAAGKSRIVLDGRAVPLVAGKAMAQFDVTEQCTGQSAEIKALSRRISYSITPEGGETENGSLDIVVSIAPLELEAPGPNVVIDGPNFVLAGRTIKGAELLAAGRAIPVKPDGSFAHVMNVSSIGSTQIEVRTKLSSMAPRILRIPVRRVDSLESAARDFASQNPITYAAIGPDISKSVGQSIVVAGKVIETRAEGYKTTLRLDMNPSLGCSDCVADLVIGAQNPAKIGDLITAYGRVSGSSRTPNGALTAVLSIDFILKGLR